jgi:hypothetical protein
MEKLDADIVSEIFKRVNNPDSVINFCSLEENSSICSNYRIWVNLIHHYYPGNAITSDPFSQFMSLNEGNYEYFHVKYNIVNDNIYWGIPLLKTFADPIGDDEYGLEIQGNPPVNEYLWIGLDGWNGIVYQNQEIGVRESIRLFKEYIGYEHNDCLQNLNMNLPDDNEFCWDEMDVIPREYTYLDYINNNDQILIDNLFQGKFIGYTDKSGINPKFARFTVVKMFFNYYQ